MKKKTNIRLVRRLGLLMLSIWLALPIFAQHRGLLKGMVVDDQGNKIRGATVELYVDKDSLSMRHSSNAEGEFLLKIWSGGLNFTWQYPCWGSSDPVRR